MEHISLGWLVALMEAVAGLAFAVIAYKMHIVYSRLGSDRIGAHLAGFSMLSASSMIMIIAALHGSPRVSLALYVSSSVLAAGGLYMVSPRTGLYSVIPLDSLKAMVALVDYIAGALGIVASTGARGAARILLALIGVSYMARGTAVIGGLAGLGPGAIAAILYAGELLRASSAAALAVYYAAPGPGSSGEEEE